MPATGGGPPEARGLPTGDPGPPPKIIGPPPGDTGPGTTGAGVVGHGGDSTALVSPVGRNSQISLSEKLKLGAILTEKGQFSRARTRNISAARGIWRRGPANRKESNCRDFMGARETG